MPRGHIKRGGKNGQLKISKREIFKPLLNKKPISKNKNTTAISTPTIIQ